MKRNNKPILVLMLVIGIIANIWAIDDIAKLATESSTMSVLCSVLCLVALIFIDWFYFKTIINQLKKK